jgi:hypothetical protein
MGPTGEGARQVLITTSQIESNDLYVGVQDTGPGPIMDDPNVTDKKYPGNPTKSYRSREPLRVASEVTDWQGHSPEALKAMKDHIERLNQLGVEAIDD